MPEIRSEIERLAQRRQELLRRLGEVHDPALVAEHRQVAQQLERLWEEQRIARVRLRFGQRDEILERARREKRLERAA